MGFPRQEYLSGLPFPNGGDVPTPGWIPLFLHLLHWQADFLPLSHLGSPFGLILVLAIFFELKKWVLVACFPVI